MKQETSVNVKMPKKATRAVSVPAQRSKEMNLTLLSCRKKRFIQRGGEKKLPKHTAQSNFLNCVIALKG